MKSIFYVLIISLFVSSAYAKKAFPKYEKIDKTFGDSLSLDTARLIEKKYIIPSYPLAKKAYSELLIIVNKPELSAAEQKRIEELKKIIQTYSLWVKLSKLYMSAHYSYLLAYHSVDYEKADKETIASMKGDLKNFGAIYRKKNLAIRMFFKDNKQLTEAKDYVHPAIEASQLRKTYEQKTLSSQERKACSMLLSQID